jgi:hypothetical protein
MFLASGCFIRREKLFRLGRESEWQMRKRPATVFIPQFSSEEWRGLAKCLRELALGMMDDKTRARLSKQARAYVQAAERLDVEVDPSPNSIVFKLRTGNEVADAPNASACLSWRMLAWRPRYLRHRMNSANGI